MGLLETKVYVVLALRQEPDCSAQWQFNSCSAQPQSIPAVPSRRVSLQCPTTKYPCSAQVQSILQCPTAEYLCSAQPPSIPAHQVSLQCPTAAYPAEYPCSAHPCSAQPPSIPAVPNCRVSLKCPTAEYPCSAQPQSILPAPNRIVSPIFQDTLHFLSKKSFRVGMLEVNNFSAWALAA